MQTVILYAVTVVVFLGFDFLGLRFLLRPTFARDIGDWLLETPRYGPALIFYLFYVAGILFFVTLPALRSDTGLLTVFLTAAFFGAIGYGTYEFSNYATLKDWTVTMLMTDLIWGTLLTGVSATAGLAITRMLA